MSVNVLGQTVTSWSRMKPDFSMLSLKHGNKPGYRTAGEIHKPLIQSHLNAVFPPSPPFFFSPTSSDFSTGLVPHSIASVTTATSFAPRSSITPWQFVPREVTPSKVTPTSITHKRSRRSQGSPGSLKSPKSPKDTNYGTVANNSDLHHTVKLNQTRDGLSDFSCHHGRLPMNGLDNKVPMTGNGSSNSEHLQWLADVATSTRANATVHQPSVTQGQGVTREPASPGRVVQISPSTPTSLLARTSEGPIHPTAGSLFRPPISSVTSEGGMYSSQFPVPGHHSHHQQGTLGSGTNLGHYYNHSTQLTSHFSPYYTSSYSPTRAYHQSPASAGSPGLLPQQFFQVETFPNQPGMENQIPGGMVALAPPSSQLPHSRSFLPVSHAATTPPSSAISHPSQLSKTSTFLQPHFTNNAGLSYEQARAPLHVTSCDRSSNQKPMEKKGHQTLNQQSLLIGDNHSTNGIARKRDILVTTTNKQVSYDVNTGSMKHRILRPANITIKEPPQSVMAEAPLSAPPLRTSNRSEVPSPKHPRLSTPMGFNNSPARRLSPKVRTVNQVVVSSNDLGREASSVPNFVPNNVSSESLKGSTQLHYPAYFMKGSIIQLANDSIRRVEDLTTEDFLQSAGLSPDLRIDSSTVVKVGESPASKTAILGFSVGEKKVQVTVNAPLEHPFFVFNRGWSSCSPERTLQQYGLVCGKLQVGDKCVSLTHKNDDKSSASPTTLSSSMSLGVTATPKTVPPNHSFKSVNIDSSLSSSNTQNCGRKTPIVTRKRRSSAPAEITLEQTPST